MTNIWDLNCCGEFKATMKIIQAISDLGELEKAAKIRENYKVFLVCCLSKIRFWMFRTFCSVAVTRAMLPSKCTRVFYVDMKFSSAQELLRFLLYSLLICVAWTGQSDQETASADARCDFDPAAGVYIDPHLSVIHDCGSLLFTTLVSSVSIFSISADIYNKPPSHTAVLKSRILFH